MAIDTPVFLDTSVLLPGLLEMGEAPEPAGAIVDAVADRRIARPLTAWHCVLEFYAVATRLPGGLRLEPRLAGRLVEEEILARFAVVDLPAGARVGFVAGIVGERVAAGRVYDAHVAESARLAGAEMVVTENRRHFIPLMKHGIRVLTAGEFAAEFGM